MQTLKINNFQNTIISYKVNSVEFLCLFLFLKTPKYFVSDTLQIGCPYFKTCMNESHLTLVSIAVVFAQEKYFLNNQKVIIDSLKCEIVFKIDISSSIKGKTSSNLLSVYFLFYINHAIRNCTFALKSDKYNFNAVQL